MESNQMHKPISSLEKPLTSTLPKTVESIEKLVSVPNTHPRIFIQPAYYLQNIKYSLPSIYIREGFYNKLFQALSLLPKQYAFTLYDGYRPLRVQQQLFQKFYEEIKQKNPSFSEEEVCNETKKYVSFPSKNENHPSPHLTGGAIDLTISTMEGVHLPMGTPFDCMTKKSATRYYEQSSTEYSEVQGNRRLLYHVMVEAGFSNYEEEWWHFDYGNQFWAARKREKYAMYGGITNFNESDVLKI